ncbi:MAG: agmatine deiminase family protein [Alphaproteobacteria bacterium]|nr:agmatine deiminase family protein [Alphaproteobacteria bacterium]
MRPLSSVYGEIRKMLLTYPHALRVPFDVVLQRYKGIFEALGQDMHYVILAFPKVHGKLRRTAQRAGLDPDRNLTLVPAQIAPFASIRQLVREEPDGSWLAFVDSPTHSIWAQDAYCVLTDGTQSTLLEPMTFTRGGDHFIAEQIAAHTDVRIDATRYHLEGGNMLTGDDFTLIGVDYLYENMTLTGQSAAEVTRGLQRQLGVEHLIWLGFEDPLRFPMQVFQGVRQPIFHIDMYITLGGKTASGRQRVFVGDTRLAKRLLDQDPVPDVISDAFDRVAAFLANYNASGPRFEVVRLPLDLWFDEPGAPRGTFLTYNNCLVEVFGDTRRAFVPAYASVAPASLNRRRLDSAVVEIFEGQGFDVRLMHGAYEELCKRGGSMHCITKALARGPVG